MSRVGDRKEGYVASRYSVLEKERQPFLDEARRCAALTIPWVCPPQRDRTGHSDLPKPNQGLGARGVSNLAGKFLNVLMPPGMAFFKMGLQPKVEAELASRDETLGTVLTALSKYEMDWVTAVGQDGDRDNIALAFLHPPITGQVLLKLLPEGGAQHFGLDRHVCRVGEGRKLLEVILCEDTPIGSLHKDHRAQLKAEKGRQYSTFDEGRDTIEVFTHIYLDEDDGRIHEYQEALGVTLEDTDAEYPVDACPWLILPWNYVEGENYGRGLIELHYKDLKRFDELSEALGDAAKNAAKLLWMTGGGGAEALVRKLSKAKSGDFVAGNADQVKALQQEKAADLQVAAKQHAELKQTLSLIFLLGVGLQRGGDRVTKFEVEYFARELEAAYSTEYAVLGRAFQEPFFKAKTAQLRRRGVLPSLPSQAVKVQITTGIDALGRGSDQARLENLAALAKEIAQVPEEMMSRREFMRRSSANLAVKPDGLIPSEEDAQAMAQRQQMQALAGQVAPEMMKGINAAGLQRQAAALEAQSPTPTEGEPEQP